MGYSDINAFIKEVYNNSKLAKIYDKSGVAMQIINRDYEGDVKKGGDTVHIRTLGNVVAHDYSGVVTYDSIAGTSDTLVIDQKKSFAFEVDDVDKINVVEEGKKIRYNERFKREGTNVNFVKYHKDSLSIRTYERGVEDETLSCGTGVTASALSWADKYKLSEGKVLVKTRGGELQVAFKRNEFGFNDIWLIGPAVQVFKGQLSPLERG